LDGLAYTLLLYFDFSGYCDMAIGPSLMFGVKLPLNFNSPYKSQNIADFWQHHEVRAMERAPFHESPAGAAHQHCEEQVQEVAAAPAPVAAHWDTYIVAQEPR
jgi:hypothetical protein